MSIIVTTQNRSELLPIALRSIQLQDFTEWECVIVDDDSTDDTVPVAQRFLAADARFRLVGTVRRAGLAAARNVGVAWSDGEYVCFLDDDDFLLHSSLSSRVEALDGQPTDVAGSYCDWINTDPEVGLEAFRPSRRPIVRGQVTFTSLRDGPPFIATAPMMRSTVFRAVGGFDEGFDRAEDAELWQRVLRGGFRFVDAEHLGIAYRRSPGSMVLADPQAQLDRLTEVDRRADAPLDDAQVPGPAPVLEPLADLIPAAVRAPQAYRYLAMIALRDCDSALREGRERVPESVRAEIDVDRLSDQLMRHVRTRYAIRDEIELRRAEQAIRVLVEGLVPTRRHWSPNGDSAGRLDACRNSAHPVGPPPSVVPTTRRRATGAIVLIVEAAYHVDEFGPLANELRLRGHSVEFMLSPKTVQPARAALGAFTDQVLEFDLVAAECAAAIVTLNDWGPARELMEIANRAGVPTFAKVEGVQDFDDVDTGRRRHPYRTARFVLGQGPNDVASLPDKIVHVVGSSRLERIWLAPPVTPADSILVNLNFTYNVLTDVRETWIDSVRTAIEEVGAPAGVSMHPAERSRNVGLPVHEKPLRHLLTRSGVLVSRFSTVPFEAMARGVPFVYHNPHGERVPTFADPNGAFWVTRNASELAAALREALGARSEIGRERWAEFFEAQVDVEVERSSEVRTADVLELRMAEGARPRKDP